MDQGFAGYHPLVNFIFFMGAVVMGMFFVHPAFLCVSVGAAALYYLLLTGKKGVRRLVGMLILVLCVALLNPLLNTRGDTILFTYLGGRPFTLEALLYGAATGGMFLSVLLWFACYNQVMTSDKFIFLFGRCIPAVSLLLSMVLKLVPNFKNKAAVIAGARRCIGKAPQNGTGQARLQSSMALLSVLTSWALEGAAITADSMRSRGYGTGKRSNFSIYTLTSRDLAASCIMLVGLILVVAAAARGGLGIEFYPTVALPPWGDTAIGALGYAAFLLLPSIVHIREEATWRILRSRI